MSSMPERKLAAIMFTDIVNYSTLMTKDEAEAVKTLKKKDSILKPLIRDNNGQYVKNVGDGSLSYFSSAVDAVRCAQQLQISSKNDNNLNIKIGIHLGDIIIDNNDIFGDGVNVASRLESIATEKSILISKEVYDQISNHSEFAARSLGLQSFKGVGRLIEVYALEASFLSTPSPNEYEENIVPKHKKNDGVPSIAIIPFENKGKDEDIFYSYGISAGITKTCRQAGMIRVANTDLIEKLENFSKLSSKKLSEKLDVKYIIKGSLWKLDNLFQLSIDLYDNEKDDIIWSDHFEENWNNLPLIKNKLTEGVLKALNTKSNNFEDISSIDPRAYEYYLKGKYKYEKRQNSEDTEIARSMFKKAIKLDSKLIDAILWLGETYTETGKYEEAMQIFKEGIGKAEELDNTRAKGMAYGCIGNIHWHKGRYEKSLENLYISLDIMRELNDQAGMAKSLHHIGHNYYYKGEYDKARDYYDRSIEIVKKLGDKSGMGHALLSLGNIYEVKNDANEALSCYQESYKISNEINDKYAAGYAQMGIGNIYNGIKKHQEAIDCYKDSLKTRIEIDDQNGMAYIYHNIGIAYKNMLEYEQALEFLNKALSITSNQDDQFASSATLKNIAEIYRISGSYDKALENHKKALKIRENIGQKNAIAESLNSIALTYYQLDNQEESMNYLNRIDGMDSISDENVFLHKLYLCLNTKPKDSEIDYKDIISYVELKNKLSYEIYYIIYLITENKKYLRIALEKINELSESAKDAKKFLSYPLPLRIIKSK